MKRIGSFSLAIIVFTLSIVLCFPDISFADDATTLSKSKDNPFGYSSSEAQSYVSAHKDIYDSDHILLFSYTPTNTYNWTYSQVGKNSLHLSDNQLVAFLMSKKTITAYASMFVSVLSNNNVTRGLLSSVGIATTGDSDSLVNVMDKLTGNYNYLDSLNYDEDSKTITMSNDNGSVDKLREEIQRYYYQSIGLVRVPVTSKNPATAIDMHKSYYEYEEDYMSDYNAVAQYDYSAYCTRGDIRDVIAFDLSRYNYSYIDSANPTKNGIIFLDSQLNVVKSPFYHFSDFNDFDTDGYKWYISNFFISYEQWNMAGTAYFIDKKVDSNGNFKENYSWCDTIGGSTVVILSQKYKYFTTFSSYSALYNFLHGDQNAYLSSTIDKTGEDITYTSSGSGVSPGTPVVAYSLDDCSVYDDSNDYDVGISTQDINNMDIHDGLFGKFPFSVPYQLYEWLQVLQADPVAPKLVYNYGFLLGHKDEQKYDLVIDFSIYEPWANVCKSFLRLSFTLAMSLFLYKKFKGNSIF